MKVKYISLDYKKLDFLLKNMRYVYINGQLFEIEGFYSFEEPNFRYKYSENTEPVCVNSKDFFTNEVNYLYTVDHYHRFSYKFFDAHPIEISKLFTSPKDILNALSDDSRVLEYKKDEDTLTSKFLSYNINKLQNKINLTDVFLNDINNNNELRQINPTIIWQGQNKINKQSDCIYLDNGGYIKLHQLIPIDIKECMMGL